MSVENISDPVENTLPYLSPETLAHSFDFGSFTSMAQQGPESPYTIPKQARILGIGATMATLGQEVAFYRSDIHWTNVADDYTDPEIVPLINKEPESNIEYIAWDVASIDDILAEKFDRIYAHGRDLETLSSERRQKMGQALVHLLDNGGKLQISSLDENFIEDATYSDSKNILTYSKPKAVKVQDPHLTTIPRSVFEKDKDSGPLHFYAPSATQAPVISITDKVAAIGFGLAEGVIIFFEFIWSKGEKISRFIRRKS